MPHDTEPQDQFAATLETIRRGAKERVAEIKHDLSQWLSENIPPPILLRRRLPSWKSRVTNT
jgi:hypothetical protein